MKTNAMLQKLRLTDESLGRIRDAVEKAEGKTNGEIAVALIAESGQYAFWELLAALFAGAAAFALLLPFSALLQDQMGSFFWRFAAWRLPAFFGIVSFGLIALLYALVNVPAVDRLVIPRAVRSKTVLNRAVRYFSEGGVYDTKDRSGILIFVSYMEREVRIIADTGISAKISGDLWALIAEDLASGIGGAGAEGAFVRAIEQCGELLEQYFPAKHENPNELANALVILEDGDE
jgi:putative membrane protein